MIWVLSTPWIFCLNKLVLFEQHVATVSIQCRNKKQNWLNAIPNIVASKINKEWPGPSASLICFLVWWFAEQRNHQLPLCFPASSFPFWGKLIDMPTTGMVAGCWHSLSFVRFATTLPGGNFADSFLGQELFLMHWCQHWWHQEEEFVFVCCMFVCCRTSHSTQRADKGEREEDDTTTLPGAIFWLPRVVFNAPTPTLMTSRRGVCLCFLRVFLLQDFLLDAKGQRGRERRRRKDDIARCHFFGGKSCFRRANNNDNDIEKKSLSLFFACFLL